LALNPLRERLRLWAADGGGTWLYHRDKRTAGSRTLQYLHYSTFFIIAGYCRQLDQLGMFVEFSNLGATGWSASQLILKLQCHAKTSSWTGLYSRFQVPKTFEFFAWLKFGDAHALNRS